MDGAANYMAIDRIRSEIAGDENFLDLLKPAKTGARRPLEIDNSAISQRRSDLLTCFGTHWSEFAWELRRAKNAIALRSALQPIYMCPGLDLFVHNSPQASTWKELRKFRRAMRDLTKRLGIATTAELQHKERLDSISRALSNSPADARLAKARAESLSKHASASELVSALNDERVTLTNSVREQEAYVSQSELRDFIGSKRYTLDPLSLANAMAGLPFIKWRQSIKRCSQLEDKLSAGLTYEMFKELAQALR